MEQLMWIARGHNARLAIGEISRRFFVLRRGGAGCRVPGAGGGRSRAARGARVPQGAKIWPEVQPAGAGGWGSHVAGAGRQRGQTWDPGGAVRRGDSERGRRLERARWTTYDPEAPVAT